MKRNKIIIFLINKIGIIGFVLIIVIGFYLVLAKNTYLWPFNKGWQAVMLESGEIYFGHLRLFPKIVLSEVYFIRVNRNKNGQVVSQELVPFSSGTVFGPKNKLYLASGKIIWWTDLREDSSLLNLIKEKKVSSSTTSFQTLPSEKKIKKK